MSSIDWIRWWNDTYALTCTYYGCTNDGACKNYTNNPDASPTDASAFAQWCIDNNKIMPVLEDYDRVTLKSYADSGSNNANMLWLYQ